MKINAPQSTSKVNKNSKTKKSGSSSGASFSSMVQNSDTSETSQSSGASGAQAVAGVFAVQDIASSTDAPKKQAVKRANDILEDLEEIRMGILSGTLSTKTLTNLSERLKQQQEGLNDPDLKEIVAEIELRALIELAKRGVVLD